MSGAFDTTPLRPDAPAMPIHSHEAAHWNEPVPYEPGLTARQHAAIALRVPDSGTDWLDAMIRTSLRNEFAAQALEGLCAHMVGANTQGHEDRAQANARVAYKYADAMLAARMRA